MSQLHSQAEYQPYLDELTAFASTEPRKADLLAAKVTYFELTGEIFEDDKQFEMRMASFLDWYLFDRKAAPSGKTPAQEFYESQVATSAPERAQAFRGFTETVHASGSTLPATPPETNTALRPSWYSSPSITGRRGS